MRSSRVTNGHSTIWETAIAIYTEDFPNNKNPRNLQAGEEIGFMVAYCDNDQSEEREHFIGSNPIPGEDKNRGWIDAGIFKDWVLVE